jgi:hypothetical protein
MSNQIQVVRALWGWDYTRLSLEIPESPIFENEIVYVWGKYHYKYLLERGYECILVNSKYKNYPQNDFIQKVESFDFAFKDFGSFLYVDWDVKIVKKLDGEFWNSFKDKLFSTSLYPIDKLFFNNRFNFDSEYTNLLKMNVKYYNIGWELDNNFIFPNSGLTYFSKDSYDIYNYNRKKYPYLRGMPDEFLAYLIADCDLQTYIKKYTNTSMFGRSSKWNYMDKNYIKTIKWFNDYIDSILNMNIYLEHP